MLNFDRVILIFKHVIAVLHTGCKANYDFTKDYLKVFIFSSDSDVRERRKKSAHSIVYSPIP